MQIYYVMMIMAQPTTLTWNGHTYPAITVQNLGDASIGHIGSAGAIRLAKAMWWMLARMAGWDGGTTMVPVTGITVTGAGGSSIITTDNGTLQLSAAIAPDECHQPDSHMDDSQRYRSGNDQFDRTCHGSIERNSNSKGHGQ